MTNDDVYFRSAAENLSEAPSLGELWHILHTAEWSAEDLDEPRKLRSVGQFLYWRLGPVAESELCRKLAESIHDPFLVRKILYVLFQISDFQLQDRLELDTLRLVRKVGLDRSMPDYARLAAVLIFIRGFARISRVETEFMIDTLQQLMLSLSEATFSGEFEQLQGVYIADCSHRIKEFEQWLAGDVTNIDGTIHISESLVLSAIERGDLSPYGYTRDDVDYLTDLFRYTLFPHHVQLDTIFDRLRKRKPLQTGTICWSPKKTSLSIDLDWDVTHGDTVVVDLVAIRVQL